MNNRLILFFLILLLAQKGYPLSWLDYSVNVTNDNNVFKYPVEYNDTSYTYDLKLNFKNKLSPRTRMNTTYNFISNTYNQYLVRDHLENIFYWDLDQDFIKTSVLSLVANGNYFNYSDDASAKYNYLNFSVGPRLGLYFFFLNYTKLEVGAKYESFKYPNYSFSRQGFESNIVFREEISDYHGWRQIVNLYQVLPLNLEAEFTCQFAQKTYPDRFIYTLKSSSYTYTADNRQDEDRQLNYILSRQFAKNNKITLGFLQEQTNSNANTPVFNPEVALTSSTLVANYNTYQANTYYLSGLLCYGRENSYLRTNISYADYDYLQRPGVDRYSKFIGKPRKDQRLTVFAEVGQRLGQFIAMDWMLKIGYTYEKNKSNDYYYRYKRDTYSIILNAYFYLSRA